MPKVRICAIKNVHVVQLSACLPGIWYKRNDGVAHASATDISLEWAESSNGQTHRTFRQ